MLCDSDQCFLLTTKDILWKTHVLFVKSESFRGKKKNLTGQNLSGSDLVSDFKWQNSLVFMTVTNSGETVCVLKHAVRFWYVWLICLFSNYLVLYCGQTCQGTWYSAILCWSLKWFWTWKTLSSKNFLKDGYTAKKCGTDMMSSEEFCPQELCLQWFALYKNYFILL